MATKRLVYELKIVQIATLVESIPRIVGLVELVLPVSGQLVQ